VRGRQKEVHYIFGWLITMPSRHDKLLVRNDPVPGPHAAGFIDRVMPSLTFEPATYGVETARCDQCVGDRCTITRFNGGRRGPEQAHEGFASKRQLQGATRLHCDEPRLLVTITSYWSVHILTV